MVSIKNKNIILLAFLFLFIGFISNSNITGSSIFNIFTDKATYSCYDSDGGLDYYTAGYVTEAENKKSDYCAGKLFEAYCNKFCIFGKCSAYKMYTCPNGCSNGACMKGISQCKTNNDCKKIVCPEGGFIHEQCINNICVLKSQCPTSNCIKEGQPIGPVVPNNDNKCCSGLKQISFVIKINDKCQPMLGNLGYCTKCGDAVCKYPENSCNCPEDCKSSCTPKTCSSIGKECGSYSNGCGGTLNCGGCLFGKTCSNGQCISLPSCKESNGECCLEDGCTMTNIDCAPGYKPIFRGCDYKCTPKYDCIPIGTCTDGCGGNVDCGSCPSGQTCKSGYCV